MKVEKAVDYFGSQAKLARALDLSDAAVCLWDSRNNGLVPMKHIMRLKELSNGELDLELGDYR